MPTSMLSVIQTEFGKLSSGEVAQLFTLKNSNGVIVEITNFGGIITSLNIPDKNNVNADIVLGYDNVIDYEKDPYYLGAIIGRFAGRIDQGKIAIEDRNYQLTLNNSDSQLHGGTNALNKQLWKAKTNITDAYVSLTLEYISPDGDNGFPGCITFKVIYSLNNANELSVEYFATTDKKTVINLTQHSYFNLAGHNSGTIYQHELALNADYFLPMDERIYPTGKVRSVVNSPQDFRNSVALQEHILSDDEQVLINNGFDNYWLNNSNVMTNDTYAAMAYEPLSGRRLTMYTDQPCLVFYTANYIDGSQQGKEDCRYQKHSAFCLEPQQFANKANGASISNTILTPNRPFYSKTVIAFSNC